MYKITKKITILSTYAQDELIDQNGRVVRRQKGGPAFYIKQVFKNGKTLFSLKTNQSMKVQILMTKKGEFGKIAEKPKLKIVEFSKIISPYLIISTILDEFNLDSLPLFRGKVFLDVQGYVRNGNDFGKKKTWKPRQEIFESIFCLKGTKEELKNIPLKFLKQQKQKILIVTNGKKGCEVFASGKRYIIKPTKIIKVKNTIGAGDTFFAFFVMQFIKTEKLLESVNFAVNKTSNFLNTQNIHWHNQLFRKEIGCG